MNEGMAWFHAQDRRTSQLQLAADGKKKWVINLASAAITSWM